MGAEAGGSDHQNGAEPAGVPKPIPETSALHESTASQAPAADMPTQAEGTRTPNPQNLSVPGCDALEHACEGRVDESFRARDHLLHVQKWYANGMKRAGKRDPPRPSAT